MGKYINQTSTGKQLGASFNEKIQGLVEDGATKITTPKEFQPNLVCVVNNGMFAAAGYCYSEAEFEAFNYSGDSRPKQWLIYPHAEEMTQD